MKKAVFIAIIIFLSATLYGNEEVFLDNAEIQRYKGSLGKWISIPSMPSLKQYVRKYNTSLSKVRELNGNSITLNSYLFIPYSDGYLKTLQSKGIQRIDTKASDNEFIWPLGKISHISSAFGMRAGRLHTGADVPAQRGTPVLSAMDGRIVFVGYSSGHGKTILIEHRNNFYTRYSHNSVNFVKKGDFVKRGQMIAYVGSSGRSTGNHLHFEIRYNDIPLNPLDFLPLKKNLKNVHQIRNWK